MFCEICQKETKYNRQNSFLTLHLRKEHNIESKEYYDSYIKKLSEGLCLTCGNKTKFISIKDGYNKFCSLGCISRNKDVKKKKIQKSLDKYGTKNVFQSSIVREKYKRNCLKKYGVDNFFKTKDFQKTARNIKKEKYGNENYNNCEQRKETNLKKYGTNTPLQNEEIKNKLLKTNNERYGGNSPTCNEKYKKILSEKRNEKIIKMIKEKTDYKFVSKERGFYKFVCGKCNKIFNINEQLFRIRTNNSHEICLFCNPPINGFTSNMEKEVVLFLKEYDLNILENKKNVISPLELDIYLPDLKLAFEFNGLYWHCELNKSKEYHLQKTKLCEEKGIHLVHIYEDDWVYKQEIVKSRILNLLGKSENIYARNCQIKEVNTQYKTNFLIKNHIQGNCISKINLGLYFGDELVSLMTFGKLRRNLGYKNSKEDEYELLRFCNKLHMSIVGGANKLFKYFIEQYNPKKVISYADRSWTMNNKNSLYDKLGFNFVKETLPNYYYIIDNIRQNRFKYRKSELIKEGFDKNKTEHEIMMERGIYKIYDCGQLKYEKII